MSSTEKATPASGSPAAVVVVVACSRERLRPRSQTIPIRRLRSVRRTSTFGKSHNRQPGQRLAQRSPRPVIHQMQVPRLFTQSQSADAARWHMASATLLVRANPDGRPSSLRTIATALAAGGSSPQPDDTTLPLPSPRCSRIKQADGSKRVAMNAPQSNVGHWLPERQYFARGRHEGCRTPDQATLEAFIATVESGKHDEAIDRFYTDDASMQDNLGPLRKGKDAFDHPRARVHDPVQGNALRLCQTRVRCRRPSRHSLELRLRSAGRLKLD